MSRDDWQNLLPKWLRDTAIRKMLKSRKLFLLQTIANRCHQAPDAEGTLYGAIIGYDKLAELTGMGRRTVVRHVRNLAAMGLVKITQKGGINWRSGACIANVYSIAGTEAVATRWTECQNDTPSSKVVLEGQIGTPSKTFPRLVESA